MKIAMLTQLHTRGKAGVALPPTNEIRAWARVLNADLMLPDDPIIRYANYDVAIVELTPNMFKWVEPIRSLTKVVGVVEGFLEGATTFPVDVQVDMWRAYNAVDALGVLVDRSVPWYRLLTNKPVFWMGCPYPLKWTSGLAAPRSRQFKTLELAAGLEGVKNGIVNVMVAKEVLRRCPGTKIHVYVQNQDEAVAIRDLGLKATFFSMALWPDYFKHHRSAAVGLALDWRSSWGRFSLDCAAANMACVGSARFSTQRDLYPNTTVDDPFDTDKALAILIHLLDDVSFYEATVQYARDRLPFYDEEVSRSRFLHILRDLQLLEATSLESA